MQNSSEHLAPQPQPFTGGNGKKKGELPAVNPFVVAIVGIVIVVILITVVFAPKKPQVKMPDIAKGTGTVPTIAADTNDMELIEDEWGMKITYPKGFSAKASTAEGELSAWTISNSSHPGTIRMMTKETDAGSAEDWIKKDKQASTNSGAIDTTVAAEPGKKLRFALGTTEVVIVADGQVFVFTVEPGKGEEKFWGDTFNQVMTKYAFVPFEGEEKVGGADRPAGSEGGDVVVEEEEVVE